MNAIVRGDLIGSKQISARLIFTYRLWSLLFSIYFSLKILNIVPLLDKTFTKSHNFVHFFLSSSTKLTIDGSFPSQLNTFLSSGIYGETLTYFSIYYQFMFLKQISFFISDNDGLCFGSFSNDLLTNDGSY